jgi:SAM-dependent methyltransferase
LLSESALADNPRRSLSSSRWIEENQKRHDEVADHYDGRHPEIYNPTEQRRLRQALSDALAAIRSPHRLSLDFGSGTGNITDKLLAAGREVCAADLSSGMLAALLARFAGAAESGKLEPWSSRARSPCRSRMGTLASWRPIPSFITFRIIWKP